MTDRSEASDPGKLLSGSECARHMVSAEELVFFHRQLSSFCRLDMPIADGLVSLSREVRSPALRALVDQVQIDVAQGVRLSDAMKKFPRIFPDLYLGMIAAGEESGSLPQVLERLGDYSLAAYSVRRKMQSAFLYPSIVALMVLVVSLAVSLLLLPRFDHLFTTLKSRPKGLTAVVFSCSRFFNGHVALFAGGAVLFLAAMWAVVRAVRIRPWPDLLAMNLPLVGGIVRHGAYFLFCRTLALLLTASLPAARCLALMEGAFSKGVLNALCRDLRRAAENGERISDEARRGGFLPETMVWKIAFAEQKGDLVPTLEDLARFYAAETTVASERFQRVVPPVLIFLLGGYVAVCYFAIIMPLFDLPRMIGLW